jgi:transcription initiation factor TFIID TATA-box-binding protein
MSNYTLVNVVAGGDLGVEIDLHEAVTYLMHLSPSYEPEVAPGLHFKLPGTGVTVMIFRTGKYHLTGGESVDQIQASYEELVKELNDSLGLTAVGDSPEIRNLVYTGSIGKEVDLEALSRALSGSVEYDPSLNPGLKYRKSTFPGVFTLYRTGSYTYTGSSEYEAAERALRSINDELVQLLD